jgi:hypothetical protein
MALEEELVGLYVSANHTIEMVVYANVLHTVVQDITGWTIVLDIRKLDTSGTAKLSVTGVISGVFNASPASNTQKVTFTPTAAQMAATIFTGDDLPLRHSVWRTDTGTRQPLRFGDCTVVRTTQV